MVIDLIGLLRSKEQDEITEAGPRMPLVLEPTEVLSRLYRHLTQGDALKSRTS